MKKTKRISLKIIAILIAIASICLAASYKISYAEANFPESFKAQFVFNTYEPQEYPTMQSPPIKTVINGKATEIFCCEPGRRLTSGMYTYNRAEITNLSDKIACAIGSLDTLQDKVTEDYRYKQAIIWGDYGKGGLAENGILKIDLSDGVQRNEVSPLKRVGGGDLATGKTVWQQAQTLSNKAKNYTKNATFEFVNTTPTLKVNDNGTYTIGPFRINYTKDDWSKITSIYLQDNNGNNHSVDIKPSDVPVNKNFYVTVNKSDLQNATTVKLVAEYSHEYYTGTYARYVPEGKNSHQELIIVDVEHETQKQTKDFGEVVLTIDLKGRVFLDEQEGKDLEPDGMDQDKQDPGMANVPVWLMNADNREEVIAQTTTDQNGYYEFKDVSAAGNYYVRFQYDGQLYEPTTYNYKQAKVAERSYATEGTANRKAFNNKFAEITNQTDVSDANKQIYAYTGWDGLNGLKVYNVNTSEEERDNINLGLLEREEANLVLTKDLWEVNVSINQKSQTYIYNSRDDEDMEIALRGTDVSPYERKLYREDIAYAGDNPLSVQVTYRLRLYNSSGYIDTEVTNLIDHYDTIYTPIASYTDPANKEGTAVTWNNEGTVSANGYTYNKMSTSGYSSGIFTTGDSRYVYIDYQVNADSLKELLNTNERTAENYAEIGAYKTYYVDTRLDLNKQLDPNDSQARVMHEAGEPAGLIDTNSTPGNFNPTDPAVIEFVHVTSKTDEYKNLSNEEKQKRSYEYFEDDADTAPSLRLYLTDPRTLSGNVWDDITSVDDNGIRKGDGILGAEESGINKVKVQLIEAPNYVADNPEQSTASQEQRTAAHVVDETEPDENGYYEFSGFIPGDYYIRFTYGDNEALTEYNATYNGQDYKSTYYDETKHDPNTYWYTDIETRASDATDNLTRREAVNGYSTDLNNNKATVLNKQNVEELANNTWMYADTAKMNMEIEYARQTTNFNEETDYHVTNVDFGLAERPRSELTADKKVSHVRLYTSDGQTIFDTDQKASNLAWIEGEYIQGTVDNNLIHGSTLELTYEMTVTNTGEKDYQDSNFYKTYQIPADESTMVTTRPNEVVDYVANNLNFDASLAENSGWSVVPVTDLQKGSAETPSADSLVNDSIDLSQQQTIVKANSNNELITKALKPGESSMATMKLSQQLSTGGEDDLTYNNYIEIVSSHNDNGRRSYSQREGQLELVVSIPGDFNPIAPEFIQPDAAKAEQVVILPPFGNDNQAIYYIIGGTLIGIIILGVGIYFIKKKIVEL